MSFDPRISGRRGGKSPRCTYRFTVQDVAKAAGRTVAAVQKARERGKFDPRDLRSLAAYVMGAHSVAVGEDSR